MSHVGVRFVMQPTRDGETQVELSDPTYLRIDDGVYTNAGSTYAGRVRLKRQADSYYPLDVAGVDADPDADPPVPGVTAVEYFVTTRLWSAAALTAIIAAEMSCDVPAGCAVGVRVLDGDAEYVVDDGAWVDADDTWSTPAEVEAAIASWPARVLGFKLRLTGTRIETPLVYGVNVIADLELRRTSADTSLADGWHEDAVVRTFLAGVKGAVACWRSHERTAVVAEPDPDDEPEDPPIPMPCVVDYSLGIDEQPYDVTAVGDVWNLTSDPGMVAPLTATFDTGTKRVTVPIGVANGDRLLLRLRYKPEVAYTGDVDYSYSHLPAIGIEGVRAIPRPRSDSFRVGGNEAQVRVLPAPGIDDMELDVTVFGATPREVGTTMDGLTAWVGDGRMLVSAATGMRIGCRRLSGPFSVARRGRFHVASVVVELQGVRSFRSASIVSPTLQPGLLDSRIETATRVGR